LEKLRTEFDRVINANIFTDYSSYTGDDSVVSEIIYQLANNIFWLLLSMTLAILSLRHNLNIYFGVTSPQFINQIRIIKDITGTSLYHFEDGVGSYVEYFDVERSLLSRIIYKYNFWECVQEGVIDGFYMSHPDELLGRYQNLELLELDLTKHAEDFIRLYNLPPVSECVKPPFLLVTSPALNGPEYELKFGNLLRRLAKKYHIIIKAHPGEDLAKYNKIKRMSESVDVIERNNFPAELLAWKLEYNGYHLRAGSEKFSSTLIYLSGGEIDLFSFYGYLSSEDVRNSYTDLYQSCGVEMIDNLHSI
jgi:hypothetical protein